MQALDAMERERGKKNLDRARARRFEFEQKRTTVAQARAFRFSSALFCSIVQLGRLFARVWVCLEKKNYSCCNLILYKGFHPFFSHPLPRKVETLTILPLKQQHMPLSSIFRCAHFLTGDNRSWSEREVRAGRKSG